MPRLGTLPVAALLLGFAACSTSSLVSDGEARVRQSLVPTAASSEGELAAYGQQMAAVYLGIADRNIAAQDLVSVSLIGIAAAGMLASVNGASSQSLTQIGVGGLAVGTGSRYFNFAGSTSALVTAASQHLCISTVAGSAGPAIDFESAAIIVRGYDRSRVTLRRALIREIPPYADLVAQLGSAQAASGFQASGLFPDEQVRIQTAVTECLAG
jgi:hypothetical protein